MRYTSTSMIKTSADTEKPSKKLTLQKFLPWLLLIGGIIGLICSFVIMFEKLELLQNPAYSPACDLNPIVSCGSVMASDQSHAFGFPNPIIGLVAFPVLITLGVVLLSGSTLKRWVWWGLEAGTIFGLLFIHWLFYQSVYNINALCPYCIIVWIVTITTFWYVTLYNLQLSFSKLSSKGQAVARFLRAHHLDILAFWFLLIGFFIIKHFWYYFGASI